MRLLSIDASTKSSGIAIFENNKLIHYECITASSKNVLDRITLMVQKIRQLFDKYQPDNVVMEEVVPDDVRHNQNVFKSLMYLQAAVALELNKNNVKIDFIVASHWRKICGIKTGRYVERQQLKKASQDLVEAIYKIKVNDDISDSICLGMAYLVQNRKSAF